MIIKYPWIFLRLLSALFVKIAYSNDAPYPLEITADVIVCEKNENVCVATRNVKVIYDKDKDNAAPDTDTLKKQDKKKQDEYVYELTCDQLTVTFEKDEKSQKAEAKSASESTSMLGAKNIEGILAKGSVVVTRSSKSKKEDPLVIKADKATYDPKTEKIEFFDNVRIKDGKRAYSKSDYVSMNKATGEYHIARNAEQGARTNDKTKDKNMKKGTAQTKLLLKTTL